MRRHGWKIAFVCSLVLAVACGGGSTSKPDYNTSTDEGLDAAVDVAPGDAGDVVASDKGGAKDGTEDPGTADNATTEVASDVPVTQDGVDASQDVEVGPVVCDPDPCTTGVLNSWVCGMDGRDYVNDQCAACSLCSDCAGCSGSIVCGDDPTTYIKHKLKCSECPCDPNEECKALNLADCGQVCGYDADDNLKTYADLCGLKSDHGCETVVKSWIFLYDFCPHECDACEGEPLDSVCGTSASGDETYENFCTLLNCAASNDVTFKHLGKCLGNGFCPDCAGLPLEPVCGSDGKTYANACAATTCLGLEVESAGACCFCDGEPIEPTCAKDGTLYQTKCEMLCKGAEPCAQGAVVCGKDGLDYAGECEATCRAGGILHEGACTQICETCKGDPIDPVCDPTGGTGGIGQSYQNACFAECLGGAGIVTQPGLCANCTQLCGTIAEPKDPGTVCAKDGLTWPSACFPDKCFGGINHVAGACAL